MANEGSLHLPSPQHLHTIFVDTNIDTHLALIVSIHDTISDVKDKIRAEHALCFRDAGEIAIQAIKVRRRGFFYNLADSMRVLNAFDGVKGSWFLYIDAAPICIVKAQKVPTDEVTSEHRERSHYGLPVCGVGMQKEIDFCGLLPKNQEIVMVKSLAGYLNTVEHESLKSSDALLKELPVENGPSLQNGRISPAQSMQACSTDQLVAGDRNMKALNVMIVNEAHAGSQCEPVKNSCPDGQRSHSPVVTSIDHFHRTEVLIGQENGGRKNDGLVSGDVTPSSTTQKTKSRKRGKKLKDGMHEEHLVDHNRGSKLSLSKDNDKSNKTTTLPRENYFDVKKEAVATSERLPSNLLPENLSLQKTPDAKHKKKRKRKSSKLNEEGHLDMPNEIPVFPSPQVTLDSHNSGKEGNASLSLGKSPTELNIDEQLQNDERNTNIAPDNVSSFEIANEKEIIEYQNKKTIEVRTLQVDPIDQSKKHVNLGQETSLDVSLKEPEKTRTSPQVAPEFPAKLSCRTGKLRNQSTSDLAYNETNDHQKSEFDAAKCITELNLREETGSVDANMEISASSDKLPYQQEASNIHSKDISNDKHQGLDKEINAAANLNGANRDKFLAKVNSEVPSTSRSSRKKSRSASSRVLGSTGHSNSHDAQVFSSDVQNDATIFVKQADQKVVGGHSVDSTIEIPTSTKKLPNQDQVPDMNTVQEKQHRSRKNSKNELSKLGSPRVSDAVLPKFNGEVTKTNERSDPSKLDNAKELSGRSNANLTKSKWDRKKSKKEGLEDQVSSGMSERWVLHGPDNSSLNFVDYFVHKEAKHCPEHPSDLPSEKSKARTKHNTRRKTDMNQPCQSSPTNSVQTSSQKQHKVVGQTLDNGTSEHKHHMVTSQTHDIVNNHSNTIDASHCDRTKDSKPVNAPKAKKTQKSSKQKSSFARIEHDSSLHKADEDQECEKKLQDHVPQSSVQLLKSGDMQSKQEKSLVHGLDNMIPRDGVFCKNHYSPNKGIADEESSSDGTEDSRNHNGRYRIVKKTISRSKKIVNNFNPESLLESSGRMFSDAFCASSDIKSGSHERKATIHAALSSSGDSDSRLEELQTKANALKHQTVTSSSSESGRSREVSKAADDEVEDRSRSAASSQKIVLSAILKSSSSYKKARLTASQSEFAITESQPVDIVLETQPEPEP